MLRAFRRIKKAINEAAQDLREGVDEACYDDECFGGQDFQQYGGVTDYTQCVCDLEDLVDFHQTHITQQVPEKTYQNRVLMQTKFRTFGNALQALDDDFATSYFCTLMKWSTQEGFDVCVNNLRALCNEPDVLRHPLLLARIEKNYI